MQDIRQQISEQLAVYQDLGALKAAIEDWLASVGGFGAFEQALEAHYDRAEADVLCHWGEIDDRSEFVSLTAQQMVAKSLEALDHHQRTGKGFTQEQLEQQWTNQLGIEPGASCP